MVPSGLVVAYMCAVDYSPPWLRFTRNPISFSYMDPEEIIADIESAEDKSSLHFSVEKFASSIGMDGAYIINFHPSIGLTFVDKRPEEWMSYCGKEGCIHFDPIAHRAFKFFTWDDSIAKSKLTKGQKILMQQARDFGLNQGYNTVANTRDNSAATCYSYAPTMGRLYSLRSQYCLQTRVLSQFNFTNFKKAA